MRRSNALKIVAAALVLFGALGHAGNARAEDVPSGDFVIPAGATATFTDAEFSACNSLSWGYQLDGGVNQVQATKSYGCFSTPEPDVTVGPFAVPTTLRVFMTDNTCNFTYYSDGLPVDHVVVEGSDPYSLRFADAGGFCERTFTPAGEFEGFNFRVTLTTGEVADEQITASGTSISATEGHPFSGTVATFTDPDPNSTAAEYTAAVDWGDTSAPTQGVVSGPMGGPFTVTGSHTYTEEGSYDVTVTITDVDTPSNSATARSSATVADAALTAAGLSLVSGPTYAGPVATFTDANSFSTAADFTATIDWGDKTASTTGTVTGSGGAYTVSGSHTYTAFGFFTIKVHIVDDGGSTADATSTILIAGTSEGGSFVIGDGNAVVGTTVTFWGAQWWKLNTLSGGAAPAAFEGFENSPGTPPACGESWSTSPGNSPPPPPGPLPSFMAVIVSSSISQSGWTISGNAPHVVIVRTDPGYAADPGHAGTGTVVAVAC
jgi:hypothetical protein